MARGFIANSSPKLIATGGELSPGSFASNKIGFVSPLFFILLSHHVFDDAPAISDTEEKVLNQEGTLVEIGDIILCCGLGEVFSLFARLLGLLECHRSPRFVRTIF